MTYPSQPGYPTPQYGQPQPPGQRQNNLWLIGGAVVVILVIIMTVILLVLQRTQDSDSTEGGGEDPSVETSDDTDGGDTGLEATEMTSEACDAFDLTSFEETFGAYDPDDTYRSESTTDGLSSLSCAYYNEDFTSLSLRVNDYDSATDAAYWVESDADYYNEENGYTYAEYTDSGDAGSLYYSDDGSTTSIYLHVAFGSLEVTASTILYENESIEQDAAIAVMEDLVAQSGDLFADYT